MDDLANLLTDAEREFLQQIFEESRPAPVAAAEDLPQFDPVNSASRQLLTLLNGAVAEVMAADGRHRFRFKLELLAPAFGAEARLLLGTPEILDRQRVERAVRVCEIDSEVRVQDRSGQLQPLMVINISESGMALMVQRRAPEYRLGIAFNAIAPAAREALRRYVFERHMWADR